MAHELTLNSISNKHEMAFAGDRSDIWHGLGQELTKDSSIETWQKEAGMDWQIESSEAKFVDMFGNPQVFEGKQVLFRSDTQEPLSVVSDRYKAVQPKEVLEFFRSLVSDSGMSLSTAGTLFGGKRFWALADTNNKVVLNGNDAIGGYLLLSTSCDGSMATTAKFTSTRVVCNNTLSIAMGGDNSAAVRASHHSTFKPNSIKSQLGLFESSWDKFSRQMVEMSKIKVSSKDSYSDILALVSNDPADPTNAEVKTANHIHNLYLGGAMGSDSAGQTAYGLLNAFTEYYDHHLGRNASNKLNSALWGYGAKSKDQAFEYLLNTYEVAA